LHCFIYLPSIFNTQDSRVWGRVHLPKIGDLQWTIEWTKIKLLLLLVIMLVFFLCFLTTIQLSLFRLIHHPSENYINYYWGLTLCNLQPSIFFFQCCLFICLFVYLMILGFELKCLTLTRHSTTWAMPSSPFCFLLFFQIETHVFAWGWSWTMILLPILPGLLGLQVYSIMPGLIVEMDLANFFAWNTVSWSLPPGIIGVLHQAWFHLSFYFINIISLDNIPCLFWTKSICVLIRAVLNLQMNFMRT
jgi:hypothetical protein